MLEKEEQDADDTQLHTGVAVVVVEREALIPFIHDQRTVLLRRGLRVMNRCVGIKKFVVLLVGELIPWLQHNIIQKRFPCSFIQHYWFHEVNHNVRVEMA
jgi:hypothetical protein